MIGNKTNSLLLTPRDLLLFRALWAAKLLDREQICRVAKFDSVTRVNERLFRLHSAGFLHRYFLGTRAGGRKAIYGLSLRGARMIAEGTAWRLQRAEDELLVGEAFVEHQLAVNWCWISMFPELVSDASSFRRFQEPISAAIPLSPDGYAELKTPIGVQPVFLEVDLGNETSAVWLRKVGLYLKLATSGAFQQHFQQSRFKVAVVCTSERRLQSLCRTIKTQTNKLFYFSTLSTIQSDGFTAPHWLRADGDQREAIAERNLCAIAPTAKS
jgi:hypothetical protein